MNNRITKTLRAKAGFTLVELIVVIAILGILAGVGTVGYSGYIKKANMAADQTLLSSLNTAYAVACIENGEDAVGTDAEDITISNGVVTADDIKVNSPAAKADAIQESFEKYYEGGTFKVMTALNFVNGVFLNADSGSNMYSTIFSGLDLSSYVETFGKSTFSSIGSEDLMSKVDDVTGMVSNFFKEGGATGTNLKFALLAGDMEGLLEAYDMTQTEFEDYMGTLTPEKQNALLANYAVLLVADTMSGTDSTTWLPSLRNGITTDNIKALIKTDDSATTKEGVAKAALLYAMYTAYANGLEEGDTKTAALANLGSMDTFVQNIEDEGFTNYLNDESSTAKADLEGFIAAMGIISTSTEGNQEATKTLLDSGYNNADLISALQTLLGN